MSTAEPPFRWRSIALPALLPTLLFAIGEGAIIPIIPLFANNLGASLALAGLIAALLMIGELVGDIPSGWLVTRIGERQAMIWAALVSVVGLLICMVATGPLMLGVGIFLIGLAAAVFALARHAFLTSFVPISHRARALSSLGGIFRAGFFIGPFLTAAGIHFTGTAASAFWIHMIASLACVMVLLTLGNPTGSFGRLRTARTLNGALPGTAELPGRPPASNIFRIIWSSRRVLLRVGSGAAMLSAMRSTRTVILPLWAVSISLGDTTTAIIIGIAGAIDFALFYSGGQVMDRFGRRWAAVPAMLGLALAHLVLSATSTLGEAEIWFIAIAMALALANGVSSGVLMTLGADFADKRNPAPFLGAWRFTTGLGRAGAPLAIAAVTAVSSLPVAVAVMGVLGVLGAGYLLRVVPSRPTD